MRASVLAAAAAALFAGAALAQEIDLNLDKDAYPLRQVRIGRQVWGPRLSRLDFENRVVMILTWCITCPQSRGSFPEIGRLCEKYRGRGLVVAAFQCLREPWLVEENIVYACYELQPRFAVTRRGWVSPWPVPNMPWVAIYNAQGRMVYAGGLARLEEKLVAILDKAPDFMVGGPYDRLKGLAAEIAADKPRAGRRLAALRKLASSGDDAPEKREAALMVACIEAYARNRAERADEDPGNAVDRVEGHAELAAWFEGDEIGREAARKVAQIKARCDFGRETEAYRLLQDARQTRRSLPPAGSYDYSMNYRLGDDPLLLARRRRTLTEFRLALRDTADRWPETWAAARAVDELAAYPAPPMSREEAEAKLAAASVLVEGGRPPAQIYEGCLQLQEIAEGYPQTDELGDEAGGLLLTTWEAQADALSKGAEEYAALQGTVSDLVGRLRARKPRLPAEAVDECLSGLRAVASAAGAGSHLGAEAAAYLAEFGGRPNAQSVPSLVFSSATNAAGGVEVKEVPAGGPANGASEWREEGKEEESVEAEVGNSEE